MKEQTVCNVWDRGPRYSVAPRHMRLGASNRCAAVSVGGGEVKNHDNNRDTVVSLPVPNRSTECFGSGLRRSSIMRSRPESASSGVPVLRRRASRGALAWVAMPRMPL